jgi:hypothetical protein
LRQEAPPRVEYAPIYTSAALSFVGRADAACSLGRAVVADSADADVTVGLCLKCKHVEVIATSRQTTFYLCRLSRVDPRFRKYPALPVLVCSGHEPLA